MRNRTIVTLTMAVALLQLTGCAIIELGQTASRSTWKLLKPRPNDRRDMTQEADDSWSSVGEEARGDRPVDYENDPIKNWLMSPKARSIERNLRID